MRSAKRSCSFLFLFSVGILYVGIQANPAPGDIFKEHKWAAGMIRIASPACAALYFPSGNSANINFTLSGTVSKTNAIKAEVTVQKVLCHDATTGFEVQLNSSGKWHALGYGVGSTIPGDNYQYMIFPSIAIPLDEIKDGQNVIMMRVASSGWCPQNLAYGAILRVYYSSSVTHPTGSITAPSANSVIGKSVNITASTTGSIKQVDYIYNGLGVNWEGEGNFTQWHYHFDGLNIMHHLGTATSAPYQVAWNTEWIPTQPDGKLNVCARIVGNDDMVYMTEAVTLFLQRTGHSVEICTPSNVPAVWVTRAGAKSENFNVVGNIANAKAARICWSSWGESCIGGNVNGTAFTCSGAGGYAVGYTTTTLAVTALKKGQNTLTISGSASNEHGMEVNWPGPMVSIQYSDDDPKVTVKTETPVNKISTDRSFKIMKNLSGRSFSIAVNAKPSENHIVEIMTLNGRILTTRQGLGRTTYDFNAKMRFSGAIYLVRVKTGEKTETRKLILEP